MNDRLENRLRLPQNIVVPESQNTKTSFGKVCIAAQVMIVLVVLATVSFDDKTMLE